MIGCAHVLQNSFTSLLIKLVLSSSSIIFAFILSMDFNNVKWATLIECVNEFLNFFNIKNDVSTPDTSCSSVEGEKKKR